MPSDSSEDEEQKGSACEEEEVKENIVVAAGEEAVVSVKEDEEVDVDVDVAGVDIPASIQLDVVPSGTRKSEDKPKEQDPAAAAANQLAVTDDKDPNQDKPQQGAINIKRSDLSKMLCVAFTLIGIMAMMLYTVYDFERLSELKYVHAEQRLKKAIKAFPQSPAEFNARQVKDWQDHYWRRFNFRNISITTAAVLSSLFLAHWHRQTRVAFQSRKTLQFWIGTLVAGFMASIWGLHLMKAAERKPFNLSNLMRSQAKVRGQVYLSMIALAGAMLFMYRQQFPQKNRRSRHRRGHGGKRQSQRHVNQLLM